MKSGKTDDHNRRTPQLDDVRFAVKALPTSRRRSELSRTLAPHPLSYQELPYDPEYAVYNRRLTPERLNHMTDDEQYWAVRTGVVLRHTGELPIEVSGPDATTLLDRVFARNISTLRPNRCSYQLACFHDGGIVTDGILVRLDDNRYWMVQADGDLYTWFKAHSHGLDVRIHDPNVWVSQIQGPCSLEFLGAVIDSPYPERFNYFDWAAVTIAGQSVVITRSGFTNELGWEIYLDPAVDPQALGNHLLGVGSDFGIQLVGVPAFRARRIEAGLMNAGSDFDGTTTPFEAGLGEFVDLNEPDFIGRDALIDAPKQCRTWGMRIQGGTAALGRTISVEGTIAGRVCSSGWSPYLECGVAIARMDDVSHGPGTPVQVVDETGEIRSGELCTMPFYDAERLIPRGEVIDIPTTRSG